jgi:mono/diheme cytochrome c family protein
MTNAKFFRLQVVALPLLILFFQSIRADEPQSVDRAKVTSVFQKYCSSCHNDNESEADVSLTSLEKVVSARNADDKQHVVAGKPEESRLYQLMAGKSEPQMPPKDEPQLSPEDLQLVKAWIVEGAKTTVDAPSSKTPKATVKSNLVTSACSLDDSRLALGRVGFVEIASRDGKQVYATIDGIQGKVTSLRRSIDGRLLVVGSGTVGVAGQVSIVDLSTLKVIQQLSGHNDLVYCAALSRDGKWLASGGYDRKVILWDVSTSKPSVILTGHNGPIYDLDFHPDGRMLATASADQTLKLWSVPDGSRLDTLGQPEGEMRCVRFSPDGKLVFGGSADRQIRQWLVDPTASTGSPMLIARFAHERELLRMEFDGGKIITAAADGKVKLWTAEGLLPLGELTTTSSIPVGICAIEGTSPVVIDLKGGLQQIAPEAIAKLLEVSEKNRDKAGDSTPPSPKTMLDAGAHGEVTKVVEAEPNNSFAEAHVLQLPAEISGVLQSGTEKNDSAESDMFKFSARAGESWVIELFAVSDKSPLDSKIDILDSMSKPVLRTRLQALRESYFTFRGKDSSTSDDFRMHKWEDMELDEYLYSGGEVTRLWLYPRGPDSGYKVYPGAESRYTFFGTTPISHPLGEPAYIVRPLADNEAPLPNGLPVFPIYFENDDDPLRERGADSRLTFVAPADGQYALRIRDARGFSGEDYSYRAVIRRPSPNFSLKFGKLEMQIPMNTGLEWSVKVKRTDGMDSAIAINLHDLPEGVIATNPLIIQAEQLTALGNIYVGPNAKVTTEPIEIRMTAKTIPQDGTTAIEKELSERIKLTITDKKSPYITLLPQHAKANQPEEELSELTIRPGQTISARLRVERNGFEGGIGFGKEDSGRNLPHGAFVDNIGLNGLLIVEGQSEREFFITAAPKVKPGRYQFHFRTEIKDNPTSKPIWLNVVP